VLEKRVKNRVVAIIQARIGSNRFPGKVLEMIKGKSILEHIVLRLQTSKYLDDIVVATSISPKDSLILQIAHSKQWNVIAGNEFDVLGRFVQAALQFQADVIVRVCADCVFYDPLILDNVLAYFFRKKCDYASTTIHRTYPRGIAVEVLSKHTLDRLDNLAKDAKYREHVTLYILDNLNQFFIFSYEDASGRFDPTWRWVVDTKEDLEFAKEVYADLYYNNIFGIEEIYQWVIKHPEKIIYHSS